MLKLLERKFKNKKILITGDSGFCGSWLTLILHLLGAKIYGLSINDHKNPLHLLIKKKIRYKFKYLDIKNYDSVRSYLKKINPEIVFHLAAQPLVIESYLNPLNTYQTNTIGTLNILNSINSLKLNSKLICITTDKVYGHSTDKKKIFKESDNLVAADPYSTSKSMAEFLCKSYSEHILSNSSQVYTARGGNIIGGGDYSEHRIIPDLIKALIKKEKVIIRNPDHLRPWQHVLSLCHGYLLLSVMSQKLNQTAWNFGPMGKDYYVKDIVKLYENYFNVKNTSKSSKTLFAESRYLKLNSNQSRKYLNWRPLWGTKKSIIKTFDWYDLVHRQNKNPYDVTVKQINEYFSTKSQKSFL